MNRNIPWKKSRNDGKKQRDKALMIPFVQLLEHGVLVTTAYYARTRRQTIINVVRECSFFQEAGWKIGILVNVKIE